MLVHYIFCQSEFQQCPTPFAAKVFLSFVGHRQTHLVRQLSEAECIQHCSMSSFPYVYDEPDNLVLVRSIINNFFNSQVRDSCAKDGLHVYYKHGEARNSP